MQNIRIRLLNKNDINIGFKKILNVINTTPIVRVPHYQGLVTYIYVAEYGLENKIVGTTTLILCYKIGGHLGFIEDVAILPEYQKQGIGKIMMDEIIQRAKKLGCYKVVLLCKDENVGFYEKCGMNKYQNCMCIKF